ncbi:MAG: transcription-repair coupling factor [Clostridiales bacterium]|nr:transcription-repair coupling factor [Clostridiales bacterium]
MSKKENRIPDYELTDSILLAPLFDGEEEIKEALDAREPAALYETCEGQRAFFACRWALMTGRPVVCVVAGENAALHMAEDCAAMPGISAAYLPGNELRFQRMTAGRESAWRRLNVLSRLRQGMENVICVSAETLMAPLADPKDYDERFIRLNMSSKTTPGELISRLVECGYTRCEMVEGKGQCALRGEIVDVFPPDREDALRIEFFDTDVDSIRTFDCISQRSRDHQDEVIICPATEYCLPEEKRAGLADAMLRCIDTMAKRLPRDLLLKRTLEGIEDDAGENTGEEGAKSAGNAPWQGFVPRSLLSGPDGMRDDAEQLRNGLTFDSMNLWAGVLWEKQWYLPDWAGDCILMICDPQQVQGRFEDRMSGFSLELKGALEKGEAVPEMIGALTDPDTMKEHLRRYAPVLVQEFLRGTFGLDVKRVIKARSVEAPRYENKIRNLASDIGQWLKDGIQVMLLCGGESRAKRLQEALRSCDRSVEIAQPGQVLPEIGIYPFTLSGGFQTDKLCVITESDIFGSEHKKTRYRRTAGEKIDAFTDLKVGDYVVHESHGIGVFMGTVQLKTDGTCRDYLYIKYQGTDKLYIPTDQFDRVQKFIGSQETPPKLNSLGGNEWDRAKSRVKAGLKKLAFDLVRLYARREQTPGFSFSPDTPWQTQFEDLFPFELTPDQEKAVRDIKRDMESGRNMDRLLCGDVGYGKTEVAIRAAFKAVMDSKQVIFLAPTTILAQQHYHTLVKRMQDFPVRVEVLSRFRNRAQQQQTLKHLEEGKVDIVVGTHRLLSKDVKFRNLGLLIVDEEQRFGVAHKESIKNMKERVDVLTLSATPIPRTLHMSMVGVRDMSLLETPPEERFPVQTYVVEYNDAVIRDAIMREINRGGQVYFLYNRVASIDLFASRLRVLVPQARIVVGHGQMKEQQLEDVMLDFYDGKADVLLCSTIIENGLDVPNANTLIVFDADRFGLSQLYQLRGRVGRSNRTAYAYFTVRPDKMLSEQAQKRLSAIREFTAFGSGFRIAMRDLEIRGAGNIFGPEQSGNVSQVGYDMYCKLIEEAVIEARLGEGIVPFNEVSRVDTKVEIKIDAYLPETYVQGEVQRMEIYKRISLLRTREDREDILEELIDRFGDVPEPVVNLIDIAHLRALCGELGILRVTHVPGLITMRYDKNRVPDVKLLYQALYETDQRLMIAASREPALLFREGKLGAASMLKKSVPVMEKLVARLRELQEAAKNGQGTAADN